MEQALLEVAFQTEEIAVAVAVAVAAVVVVLEDRTSSGLELGPLIGKALGRMEELPAWVEDFEDFGDFAAAAAVVVVVVVVSAAGLGWE